MKARLIELILNTPVLKFPSGSRAQGKTYQTAQNVADHLLANGVIVPPCKVGDDVYSIVSTYSKCRLGASWDEIMCQGCEVECDSHGVYAIRQERVIGIAFDGSWKALTNKSCGNYKRIGESIYGLLLTHEEAEKALAERSKE